MQIFTLCLGPSFTIYLEICNHGVIKESSVSTAAVRIPVRRMVDEVGTQEKTTKSPCFFRRILFNATTGTYIASYRCSPLPIPVETS
ncbi:hypothetical protein J6590_089956 [Homalodisca vitripennis]|nr:hypothetical protein J6590_089956 [Homalodisca vitripennis]